MATDLTKRPNKKLRDRLEVQDRFRVNLESIIKKYDKPFEDSPVLNLENMSIDQNHSRQKSASLDFFSDFGRTAMATDYKEGKARKGGVSSDSALGSLPKMESYSSPSSSSSSSSSTSTSTSSSDEEEDDYGGDICLQDLDFTHEQSDSLGAFVRYKYTSLCEKPGIAGREGFLDGITTNSDDDLGSVCSGPRSPIKESGDINHNQQVAREICRTGGSRHKADIVRALANGLEDAKVEDDVFKKEDFESDDLQDASDDTIDAEVEKQRVGEYREAAVEKVTSWLKRSTSCTLKESSSELEMEEFSQQSTGEYPPLYSNVRCDENMSLFELRERFVRKVHSILVEGNNETDDITSADDMDVPFPCSARSYDQEMDKGDEEVDDDQEMKGDVHFSGKNHHEQRGHKEDKRQVFKNLNPASSRRLEEERSPSRTRVDRSCSKTYKPACTKLHIDKGNDSTIIAGHFNNSHESTEEVEVAKCEDVKGKEVDKTMENCIELVPTPSGQLEWTVNDKHSKSGGLQGLSSPYSQGFKYPLTGTKSFKTPEKVPSHKANRPTNSSNPCQVFQSVQKLKYMQSKQICDGISEAAVQESSNEILNNIMDFFKSPLPQILKSPMPILSPSVKRRTVQGKPVGEQMMKDKSQNQELVEGGTTLSAFQSNAANSSSSLPKCLQTRSLSGNREQKTVASCRVMSETKSSETNDLNTSTFKCHVIREMPHEENYNIPQGSDIDIDQAAYQKPKILDNSVSSVEDESGDISLLDEISSDDIYTSKSRSRSGIGNDSNSLKSPSFANKSSRKSLVKVSNTPKLSSPFGHMKISSEKKQRQSDSVPKRRGNGQSSVATPRGLVFGGDACSPKAKGDSSSSMEVLEYSSNDEDNECKMLKENKPQDIRSAFAEDGEHVTVLPNDHSERQDASEKASTKKSGIASETFLVGPARISELVSTANAKAGQHASTIKGTSNQMETLRKLFKSGSSKSVPSSSARPSNASEGSCLQKENLGRKYGKVEDKQGVKEIGDASLQKPQLKTVVGNLKAKHSGLDVSFLSSTRLDEDLPRRSVLDNPEILAASKAENAKHLEAMERHSAGVVSPMRKILTPSKRRRRGSDRANSLESPAKKKPPKDNFASLQESQEDDPAGNQYSWTDSPAKGKSTTKNDSGSFDDVSIEFKHPRDHQDRLHSQGQRKITKGNIQEQKANECLGHVGSPAKKTSLKGSRGMPQETNNLPRRPSRHSKNLQSPSRRPVPDCSLELSRDSPLSYNTHIKRSNRFESSSKGGMQRSTPEVSRNSNKHSKHSSGSRGNKFDGRMSENSSWKGRSQELDVYDKYRDDDDSVLNDKIDHSDDDGNQNVDENDHDFNDTNKQKENVRNAQETVQSSRKSFEKTYGSKSLKKDSDTSRIDSLNSQDTIQSSKRTFKKTRGSKLMEMHANSSNIYDLNTSDDSTSGQSLPKFRVHRSSKDSPLAQGKQGMTKLQSKSRKYDSELYSDDSTMNGDTSLTESAKDFSASPKVSQVRHKASNSRDRNESNGVRGKGSSDKSSKTSKTQEKVNKNISSRHSRTPGKKLRDKSDPLQSHRQGKLVKGKQGKEKFASPSHRRKSDGISYSESKQTNTSRLEKSTSSSNATGSSLDMMMMSSMCEGPGKCNKTICFTCAADT